MDRPRILVVDDEPMITDVLVLLLAQSGEYEVRAANRPEDAITIALEWRPHLLVLDIVMPSMDGGDVLAAVRAAEGLADVPAIFLTGLVTDEEIEDGHQVGGQPVLPKPIRRDDLLELVAKQLSGA